MFREPRSDASGRFLSKALVGFGVLLSVSWLVSGMPTQGLPVCLFGVTLALLGASDLVPVSRRKLAARLRMWGFVVGVLASASTVVAAFAADGTSDALAWASGVVGFLLGASVAWLVPDLRALAKLAAAVFLLAGLVLAVLTLAGVLPDFRIGAYDLWVPSWSFLLAFSVGVWLELKVGLEARRLDDEILFENMTENQDR